MPQRKHIGRFAIVVVGGLVAVAAVIILVGFHTRQSPLTDLEIDQLEEVLGIGFPSSTSAIRVWFSSDGPDFELDVRVHCATVDVETLVGRSWLTPAHNVSLDEGEEYFCGRIPDVVEAQAWQWEATPLRSDDRVFWRRIPTTHPVASNVGLLIRVSDDAGTLYFTRDGSPNELPASLISALLMYDIERGLIPSWGAMIPSPDPICGRRWP